MSKTLSNSKRSTSHSNEEQIWSVSALNETAHNILNTEMGRIKVEGEITELTRHRSGHWYFTLKDEAAQLRVAMFRYQNQRVKQAPNDGDKIIIVGKLSIYGPRGNYQLIAESIEPAGLGILLKQFEALKAELQTLGWFSEQAKQALPTHTRTVAIVTSPQAAAFADMRSTFQRRNPLLEIILVPVPVQGTGAAEQIGRAIEQVNLAAEKSLIDVDAIIVGRGGGALEDLWAFNERVVAEAIFHSKLPVVSAVGHESDITISDLVADRRAATPTAAAELLSVDNEAFIRHLATYRDQLASAFRSAIARKQHQLSTFKARLRHPGHKVAVQAQRLDHLDTRMFNALTKKLEDRQLRHSNIQSRLQRATPEHRLSRLQDHNQNQSARLHRAINARFDLSQTRAKSLAGQLNLVSPLSTLARGYTITSNKDGQTITKSLELKSGDIITTRFKDGAVESTVN